MTPENFAYWCQGFIELTNGAPPTPAQWEMIKEHLALVFTKVTKGFPAGVDDNGGLRSLEQLPTYCGSIVGNEGVGPSSANWPTAPVGAAPFLGQYTTIFQNRFPTFTHTC